MNLEEQAAFYFEQLKPEAQQDYLQHLQEVASKNDEMLLKQRFEELDELTQDEQAELLYVWKNANERKLISMIRESKDPARAMDIVVDIISRELDSESKRE